MRDLFSLFILTILISSCGSQYTEEEQQTMIAAEKAHFEAIQIFGETYDKLNIITSLQDSLDSRISMVSNYEDMDGVDQDSIRQVSDALTEVRQQLTDAKNNLLSWSDEIYGLPDNVSPYAEEDKGELPSIAKDQGNDMITNNIKYKELPESLSPDQLLNLQEEQLTNIRTIRMDVEAAIRNAENTIAENL